MDNRILLGASIAVLVGGMLVARVMIQAPSSQTSLSSPAWVSTYESSTHEISAHETVPPEDLPRAEIVSVKTQDQHRSHSNEGSADETSLEDPSPADRLDKVHRLMSLPVAGLTAIEKQLLGHQIVSELPYLVRTGEMHPYDAVFAHVRVAKRQDTPLAPHEVERIQEEYTDLYPLPVQFAKHLPH